MDLLQHLPARSTAGVQHYELPLDLCTQTFQLPVVFLEGQRPGPKCVFAANLHGNEYTGTAILHHLMGLLRGQLDRLAGRVVCLPTLNPAGLHARSRNPPWDRSVDPNRVWEGAQDSPTAALLAAPLTRLMDALQPACFIDLHTHSTLSLPHARIAARTAPSHAAGRALAAAIGLPLVLSSPQASMYSFFGNRFHIPAALLELGPSDCIDPKSRAIGLRALLNAVAHVSPDSAIDAGHVPSIAALIPQVPASSDAEALFVARYTLDHSKSLRARSALPCDRQQPHPTGCRTPFVASTPVQG